LISQLYFAQVFTREEEHALKEKCDFLIKLNVCNKQKERASVGVSIKKIPKSGNLKQIAREDRLRGFRKRCGGLDSERQNQQTSTNYAFNPYYVKRFSAS